MLRCHQYTTQVQIYLVEPLVHLMADQPGEWNYTDQAPENLQRSDGNCSAKTSNPNRI